MKQSITVIVAMALCGMSFWMPGTASAAEQEQDIKISDEQLTDIETESDQEQSLQSDEGKISKTESEGEDIESSEQSAELEESETENSTEENLKENTTESTDEEEISETESEEDESYDDVSETETNTEENESEQDSGETIEDNELEELTDLSDESGKVEKRWKAGARLTSLLMPQKFEIVMDPFEMDKRTQVYSKEYKIRNTGELAGTLQLTGIANESGENVKVCASSEDVHRGRDKNIFIELVINGEERVVLSPEGVDYEIVLEPDEELTLEFSGEMNENSSQEWQGSDVKITVVYNWEAEPEEEMTEEELAEEETSDIDTEEELTEEESKTEETGMEESSEIDDIEEESSPIQEEDSEAIHTEEESESIFEDRTMTEESEETTEGISDEEKSSLEETGTETNQTETQQEDTETKAEAENEQED